MQPSLLEAQYPGGKDLGGLISAEDECFEGNANDLAVAYIIVVHFVVKSKSKTTRVLVLVGWALLGLAIGHFAFRLFG